MVRLKAAKAFAPNVGGWWVSEEDSHKTFKPPTLYFSEICLNISVHDFTDLKKELGVREGGINFGNVIPGSFESSLKYLRLILTFMKELVMNMTWISHASGLLMALLSANWKGIYGSAEGLRQSLDKGE